MVSMMKKKIIKINNKNNNNLCCSAAEPSPQSDALTWDVGHLVVDGRAQVVGYWCVGGGCGGQRVVTAR